MTADTPRPPACLLDRDILWHAHFGPEGEAPLDPERLNCGPGRVLQEEGHLTVRFDPSDAAISQQARYAIDDPRAANGMGMRVRISGWESINYIAIGHTGGETYHHVKATHPRQGEWFDFCVGFDDLAWGWRNAWDVPEDTPLRDVRFYIKGVAGEDARIDISDVHVWQEAAQPEAALGPDAPLPAQMTEALNTYQKLYFTDYARQARDFMTSGTCPLASNVMLDWPFDAPIPPDLTANGTYQYSWHSLHPVVLLLLLAREERRPAPVFAARDMVVNWLDNHLDTPTDNLKYAWYDHGVAERTFAFLMLYEAGREHGFDIRFMTRLRRAIHAHAQLLASEAFYAGHQPTRYHNHAWFQDIALLTVGLFFPEMPVADHWITVALERIEDQFTQLIVRDGGFAVFAENSFGYHLGVEKIVANVGFFAGLSGRETEIPAIAEAMARFSALIRYPVGKRTPAQGDSFRLPNAEEGDATGRKPYAAPQVAILPQAGYAVVKANHAGHPFMLTVFASSHSRTHKHADNLSFTLYADGIEWLLDPSFHSHEYTQPVPAYLRGPQAHNALVLPEERAYSIAPGLAKLSGEATGEGFAVEGSHDAYEGVRIHRRIEGSTAALDMRVTDREEGAGEAPGAKLMLHCGEGVEVMTEGTHIRLTHPASTMAPGIELPEGCEVALHKGRSEAPVRGVAGTRFLETHDIVTIEITPPDAGPLEWALKA